VIADGDSIEKPPVPAFGQSGLLGGGKPGVEALD